MLLVGSVSGALRDVVIACHLMIVVCNSCLSLRPLFNETIEETPVTYVLDENTRNSFWTSEETPYCFYGMLVGHGSKMVTGGRNHPPLIDAICRDSTRRVNGLHFDVFLQRDNCNGDFEVFYVCCVDCTALYHRTKCNGSSCAINNFSALMHRAYVQNSWYNTYFVGQTREKGSFDHFRSYRGLDDTVVEGPSCWDKFGRPVPSGSTVGMCFMSVSRSDLGGLIVRSDSYLNSAKRSMRPLCNTVPRSKFKNDKFVSFCAHNGTAFECCCLKEDITANDSCLENMINPGRRICDHFIETNWTRADFVRKSFVKYSLAADSKTLACRAEINLDEGGRRKHLSDPKRHAKWDESFVLRATGGVFGSRNPIRARSFSDKNYTQRLEDGLPCLLGDVGDHLEVVLQCQHTDLCNTADKELMRRVVAFNSNAKGQCRFNSRAQFYLNDLDKPAKRYCYSHYASEFALSDEEAGKRHNGVLLNVFNGMNIVQLDSAYDFHDGNGCKFLEVRTFLRDDLNANCRKKLLMPDTQYLPWTLFVCRCEGDRYCDSTMHEDIAQRERDHRKKPDIYIAKCLSFEGAKSPRNETNANISIGHDSFFCYLSADVQGNGEIVFAGGKVDRNMMNEMKIRGDHLAFTMMSRVKDEGAMCRGRGKKTTCVCRTTYLDWKNGRTMPCNSRLSLWHVATWEVQRVTVKYHLKKGSNKIVIYRSPLIGSNGRADCYRGGVTSIFSFKDDEISDEMYCNDDASTSRAEQRALCRAELLKDGCVEYNNEQLCCCFDPKKCYAAMTEVIMILKQNWQ